MQYIVWSRGTPIGVTDLGFAHDGGPGRSGWFHPNAEGERTLHRAGSLELTLHREDGSCVPTELVRIEDSARLLAPAVWDEAPPDVEPCEIDPLDDVEHAAFAEDAEPAVDVDLAPEVADVALDAACGPFEAWTSDDEPPELPRYRIHVVLDDPAAIP